MLIIATKIVLKCGFCKACIQCLLVFYLSEIITPPIQMFIIPHSCHKNETFWRTKQIYESAVTQEEHIYYVQTSNYSIYMGKQTSVRISQILMVQSVICSQSSLRNRNNNIVLVVHSHVACCILDSKVCYPCLFQRKSFCL